jgi:hypothetical protein
METGVPEMMGFLFLSVNLMNKVRIITYLLAALAWGSSGLLFAQSAAVRDHTLRTYTLQKQQLPANIRASQKVKVTYANGRSDSVMARDVKANASVIGVGDSIITDNLQKQRALKDILKLDVLPSFIKTIPELYIKKEEATGLKKTYSLAFVPLAPMLYDFEQESFAGKLSFYMIEDPIDPSNTEGKIAEPVIMEVTSPEIPSITPKDLKVSHLYIPALEIELRSDRVQDSALVLIRTVSNPSGYKTYVRVTPALEIKSNRTSMQGFGIQEIPLTVRYIGSNSAAKVKITLTTEQGTLTPNELNLPFNEPATVLLRSEGVGASTITAVSSGQESNAFTIEYVFPWVFLVASMLGGLLGAVIKFYSHTGKKKLSFSPFLIGIAIGLVGAVAYYALGINLIGIKTNSTFNEFAVFGFSAVCAYFGIKKGE